MYVIKVTFSAFTGPIMLMNWISSTQARGTKKRKNWSVIYWQHKGSSTTNLSVTRTDIYDSLCTWKESNNLFLQMTATNLVNEGSFKAQREIRGCQSKFWSSRRRRVRQPMRAEPSTAFISSLKGALNEFELYGNVTRTAANKDKTHRKGKWDKKKNLLAPLLQNSRTFKGFS